MELDLRKLQHVVVLAKLKSYVQAASELHITQSALSRSIQSFEARFGVRLFDRDRSGVALTAAGKALLARSRALLADARNLEQMLRGLGDGNTGSTMFGMGMVPTKIFLKPLLADLIQNHPGIRAHVETRSIPTLVEMLTEEAIDFFVAVQSGLPRSHNFTVRMFGDLPAAILVRAGHPLLKQRRRGTKEIVQYRVLSGAFAQDIGTFKAAADWAPKVTTDDHETLKSLTLDTDCVWLTSPLTVAEEIESGKLVALPPVENGLPTRFNLALVTFRGRSLSPTAELVVAKLKALAAKILTRPAAR